MSNGIWDKQGELTVSETERVRLHPYLTERTLASSPGARPLGRIAIQHHERLDGSGYPRGLKGDAITPGGPGAGRGRHVPGQDRAPTPPAGGIGRRGGRSRARRGAGRPLDGDAVDAVLAPPATACDVVSDTRGRPDPTRSSTCCGCSARGCRTSRSPHGCDICRKTAGNHVEHIYMKLGVTNRALASLFAAKHGLMD